MFSFEVDSIIFSLITMIWWYVWWRLYDKLTTSERVRKWSVGAITITVLSLVMFGIIVNFVIAIVYAMIYVAAIEKDILEFLDYANKNPDKLFEWYQWILGYLQTIDYFPEQRLRLTNAVLKWIMESRSMHCNLVCGEVNPFMFFRKE